MEPLEIGLALGRIETQGKATHDMVAAHIAVDDAVHKDHETRIRSSEKFRWLVMGAIILVTSIGGWGLYA
jgi:hypothetical protein